MGDVFLKKIWKKFLNRKITILVVPFTQASVRQAKVPIYTLLTIIIFTVSVFGSAFYIISRHVNYQRVLVQNKALRVKIDAFASESFKLSNAAKKVYGLELSLKQLLGMKSKRN